MSSLLIGLLIGLPIFVFILFARFGGSIRRSGATPDPASTATPAPSASLVTVPVTNRRFWSWVVVPLVAGLVLFLAFLKEKPGEVHSVKVVMNNPSGVRIEGLKPGRYWFWAEETPRIQMIGGRMVSVWPDGRTSDEVGGTTRPGYYENNARQQENPIPGVTTFALIVWGKNGPQAFRKEGGIIEVDVAGPVIFDQNVPRGESQLYVNNGGEQTIYYQRRG